MALSLSELTTHPSLHHMKSSVLFALTLMERAFSRLSRLKRRHFFTARKTLRLRYFVPLFLFVLTTSITALNQYMVFSHAEAGMISAQGQIAEAKTTLTAPVQQVAFTQAVPDRGIESLPAEKAPPKETNVVLFLKNPMQQEPEMTAPTEQASFSPPHNIEESEVTLASFYKTPKVESKGPDLIKIESGETITGRLQEIGISSQEVYSMVKALGQHYNPRHVRPGQSFEIEYTHDHQSDGTMLKSVSKMTMPISPAKQIVVYKEEDAFKAREIEKKVITQTSAKRATLKYSLYGSAAKANIPDEVIAKMIKIFSWSVDFQRDIRSGDEIEILYETKATEDGTHIGYGDILYARLVTGGQDLSLYRHKMQNGDIDYYDPKGQSIKRTLMKTPVDGARMSSGFGMRHHPVLGYSKMHKGADFAAPRGTPIYAAGDGVIEKAGRNGSYGNYIRIRHNSKLKTAYAHLQKFKSGIRAGSRVKQGQVIGYVGTTGRSTGPHLHYEVLINGKQVNPRGVNVPTGDTLSGKELQRFNANRANFDQEFVELTRNEKYAQAKTEAHQKSIQ